MTNLFPWFLIAAAVMAMSCGNNNGDSNNAQSKTQADSLFDEVMDGHNVGMAKMFRLTKAEQTTKRLLDSIAKLPDRARRAAGPFKVQLDSLQKDLSYAEFAMNKWMDEFNADSAADDVRARINYLEDEKLKVTKVKEAILGSLQKADSLLKEKL